MIVRCSSLDRVLDCAGSLEKADAPYNPNNPEAREGTAAHKAVVAIPLGDEPDIDAVAAELGVDADELAKLMPKAREAWDSVSPWFTGEVLPEHPMEAELGDGVTLRGTTDLMAVTPDTNDTDATRPDHLSVLDWKFGWSPSEHPNQVRGYSYLARDALGMPTSGYVLGVEIWVRVGELRVHKFTEEDLDRLRDEVLEQARRRGKQYGPSLDACRYCPRQLECQARADWLRSGVTALEPVARNAPITPELVGALYERSRELGSALSRYNKILDAMLEEGPVPLPDGRRLTMEKQQQDRLMPSKAMAFLREELQLTPAEADEVLGVTKAGLQRVLRARAPERKGAEWMRNAMRRLNELGAVDKTTVKKKKVV